MDHKLAQTSTVVCQVIFYQQWQVTCSLPWVKFIVTTISQHASKLKEQEVKMNLFPAPIFRLKLIIPVISLAIIVPESEQYKVLKMITLNNKIMHILKTYQCGFIWRNVQVFILRDLQELEQCLSVPPSKARIFGFH